jgi:hypothetical protein
MLASNLMPTPETTSAEAFERYVGGVLRVPCFLCLIGQYMAELRTYDAGRFKVYVESLGVLRAADWQSEANGYAKWKHRTDRAAQKFFTGV